MNKLSLQKLQAALTILMIVMMSFFLVFWKSPHEGFGDDGIYVEAGNRLVSGLPMYIDGFRGGQVGALFLFLFSEIFFGGIAWAVFQLISISSVVGSVFMVATRFDLNVRLLIAFFAISSAPTREMLHNHQITALVIFLSLWPFFYVSNRFGVKAIQILGAALAIDLKPQISLVLIFGIALSYRRLHIFFVSLSGLIFMHLCLNIWRGENIDAQWFKTITQVGSSSKWGESIHPWPLIANWMINDSLLKICVYSTIFVLLVAILRFAIIRKPYNVLVLASLLTYFFTYSHFYDCILIAIFASINIIKTPNKRNLLFMSVGLVPGFLFDTQNFIFWLAMMQVFLLFGRYFTHLKFIEVIMTLLLALCIHFTFTQFSLDFDQEVRARSALYVFLFCLTIRTNTDWLRFTRKKVYPKTLFHSESRRSR